MAAVGTSQWRADAETALGEIQSVADLATDSVVLHPSHETLVHTTLVNQILQQAPNRIIGERCDMSGVETEASFQSARDVVFASTLAHVKRTRGPDAASARIKTQHDFAETDDVPATLLF